MKKFDKWEKLKERVASLNDEKMTLSEALIVEATTKQVLKTMKELEEESAGTTEGVSSNDR